MAEHNKVVVHYLDGTTKSGTTLDFYPNRPSFHFQPEGETPVEVFCKTLKAVFFVKDFRGNPRREDIPGFIAAPAETSQGRKVAVRFKDGELLCGYTLAFSPSRDGFMLFPADSQGNNIRVLVMRAATTEIKIGAAAEALATSVTRKAG
jgi:hypothetical protein